MAFGGSGLGLREPPGRGMRSPQRLPEPLGGRGERARKRRCGLYVCLRKAAGVAAHVSAFGLSVYLGALSRLGTSRFSWHPACMALAVCWTSLCVTETWSAYKQLSLPRTLVCFCMTEAILTFSLDSSPFFFCSIKAKVRIHWMMQVLAAVFASIGLVFIFSSKNISESPHFTSWHSILGITTAVAVCGQLLCGLCLLFPKLINTYSVTRLRLYHATCGLVAYLMATVTVVLGLCSDWFKAQVNGTLWYLCIIVPLIPALVIMNQVNNGYLSKKKIEI